MPQVTIADWLNELETTELPQCHRGAGSNKMPCALSLAVLMSGEHVQQSSLPTTRAFELLGGLVEGEETPLAAALREVYRWNDRDNLTFKEIAARFRKTYPEFI